MQDVLDLDRYPLDAPASPGFAGLVASCRAALVAEGLFNLPGFLLPDAVARTLSHVRPRLATQSFHHARDHNIYFSETVPGLAPDDPALAKVTTQNHTLCHDQLRGTPLDALYTWQPFMNFLAAVTGNAALYTMDDPLSGVNVLEYRRGEALNWHFDRSVFTTTLLLQRPEVGGDFEYVRDLRSAEDPNHAGIAALLRGEVETRLLSQEPGTLNVFLGVNTAHRVTPPTAGPSRIVSVLAHYDRPGVRFSQAEQMGFYGRTA
ncbi:MAG: 2OG-Fe(II) oxygenase [Pseudomonadota bacterium]